MWQCVRGDILVIGLTSVILRGGAEVVNMTVYGQDGGGLKGANFDLLVDIHMMTDGERRFVIAAEDYDVTAGAMDCPLLRGAFKGPASLPLQLRTRPGGRPTVAVRAKAALH